MEHINLNNRKLNFSIVFKHVLLILSAETCKQWSMVHLLFSFLVRLSCPANKKKNHW